MNHDIVSVIVITYNNSKFIVDTLESIKQQTYKNIELIVTDDGSQDCTLSIVEEWMDRNKGCFDRNHVIGSPLNTGIPSNCNRGLKLASGAWIKFIAGDDVLLSECIEINYNEATKNTSEKIDFLYSKLEFFNSDTTIDIPRSHLLDYFNILSLDKKQKFYARNSFFLNTPSWFINKKVLSNGFDETYKLLEDQPFLLSILYEKANIKYIDQITVKYRVHNESTVQREHPSFIADIENCFLTYRSQQLKWYNIKDLLYIFDIILFIWTKKKPENKLVRLIYSRLNIAKYFKRYIETTNNNKINIRIKHVIS